MHRLQKKFSNLIFGVSKLKPARNCFITCAGKVDGVGAQAQAVLSTMLFARGLGIQYAHTPFSQIAHNDEGDERWEAKWEDFFHFGAGEILRDDVENTDIEVIHSEFLYRVYPRARTLWVVPHAHAYADAHAYLYKNLLEALRFKMQLRSVEMKSHRWQDRLTIALHLRRGDVSSDEPGRFTANAHALALLENVVELLKSEGLDFGVNLYSEGVLQDFEDFLSPHVRCYIGGSVFETLHNMIDADVLIMAKSSLSYTAGILSGNVSLYEKFWHTPLPNWIQVGEQGSFDEAMLVEEIRRLSEESG